MMNEEFIDALYCAIVCDTLVDEKKCNESCKFYSDRDNLCKTDLKLMEAIKEIEIEHTKIAKLITPNLVIYESDGDFDGVPVYDMARCPNCDTLIMDDEANWGEPYCMKCGQALKWDVAESEGEE